MKKVIIFLLTVLFIGFQAFSQKNEYQYLALKFGASHGFSSVPGLNENKFLYVGLGEEKDQMSLVPTGSSYVPGFVFDVLYHFDFTSDNAGIYTGLEYNFSGIGAKYKTKYGSYTSSEIHRFHSIGVPVAFKYGPNIWKTQRYLVIGAQINMMLTMTAVQKSNSTPTPTFDKLSSDEYKRMFFNLFIAVNYSAFNLQLDFYPKSIFNKSYEELNENPPIFPYESQVDQFFVLKTTVNVPYGWLSEKSFWWRKKLRNTPWR